MASELTLTSTTDSENDVRAALGLEPTSAPAAPDAPEGDASAADPEAAPQTPESDAGRTLAHKRNKLQGRIGKLKAEQKAAAAQRDDALRAKARIEAEFEAFKRGQTTAPAPVAPVVPAPVVATPMPEPKEDDFPTYGEYTKALTKWAAQDQGTQIRAEIEGKIAQERERARRAAAEAQHVEQEQARRTTFLSRVDSTKAKHPDYDEVIAKSRDIPLSQPMIDVIHDSEHGGELLYYFATNPAEAEKIRALTSPAVQLLRLGALEDRSVRGQLFNESADDTPPVGAAPSVPVSRAPAPLPRVGGSAAATQSQDPSTMNLQQYKEWRARTGRRVGGRR